MLTETPSSSQEARARQQAAVAELGQRALAGADLLPLMDEAAHAVTATLDVEYCKVLELLPDGQALLLRAGVGWREGLVGHATVGAGAESQAGYILLSSEPVIVEDLATETRFRAAPLLREHHVVSGMSVIIHGWERPFGVLGAHTATRRTFTQDDINFLQSVANVLALALERKRAEDELRAAHDELEKRVAQRTAELVEANTLLEKQLADLQRAEASLEAMRERFRGIYESSTDAIVHTSLDGHILDVNAAFTRLTGYRRDEVANLKYQDLTPQEYHAFEAAIVGRVVESGEAAEYEKEYIRKDGTRVPIALTVFVVHGADGQHAGLAAIVKDITERKRAEEALRKETAYNDLLQAVAIAANEAETVEDAVQTCLDKICDLTRWPVGHLYLLGETSEELVPTSLWRLDHPERFETFRQVTMQTRFVRGVSLPGRVLESGKPVWIEDVTHDPGFVRARLAADIGVKAGFGFPIVAAADVVGVLEFFSSEALAPDASLLKVMAHVGTQLGQVVERQRAQDALRASEERARTQYKGFPIPTYTWQRRGDDFVLVDYNDAALFITQGQIQHTVGKFAGEVFLDTPEAHDDIARCYSLQTNIRREMTHRLVTTGETKQLSTTYAFVPPDLVMVHTEDITERKRAEAALQKETSYNQLLQAIAIAANEAATMEDAVQICLDRICTLTGWPVGHLFLVSKDDPNIVMATTLWNIGDDKRFETFRQVTEGKQFAYGESLPGRVLESGKPAWINDVTKDSNFPRTQLAIDLGGTIGVKAAFGFPVLIGTEVVGVLEFFSTEAVEPDESLLAVMTHIGTQLGRVVERERAEQALRESEERFRSVVESASDAIVLCDGEGRTISWNKGAEQIFGYSEDEALAKPLCDFIMPERYRAGHREGIERLCAGGEPRIIGKTLELHGLRKDGREFPLELALDAWKTADGTFYSGIMRDVTERKRAEEERARLIHAQVARAEAEASERRSSFLAQASSILSASLDYEVTLNNLSTLVVPELADWYAVDMLDADGVVRRLALGHVDPRKIELAHEIEQRYPPDPNAPHGVPNVLRTGKSEFYSEIPDAMLEASTRDADHLQLARELGLKSAMIVPLIARGRTLGAITFVTAESGRLYTSADLALAEDLARRTALAVDNARLYREAQEANRSKDEFLAMLSHELRTPLTSMLGWAQLLRSGKLDAATQERALETIERNTKAQAQLIEDLLDLSRIITGKLRLEVRPMELAPVIEAALDAARPAADAKAIQLQLVLNPNVGLVSGDADRLQQVVWNLLSNAIKFTPKEGRVEVRLERVNSQVAIVVSDTGQGISEEFLPFVFDRFRQADMGLTRRHGGLGLGLAIVRHMVELHGGTVSVTSPGEGLGSTFTVKIPLMPLRNGNGEAPAETGAAGNAGDGAAPLVASLTGVRVLLVDDEADARELLTAVLERAGAEVCAAASVAQALEVFAVTSQWRPDVLVSDIGMPGEDGYSLIRKVRALEPERAGEVPAAALTAYARAEDRLRALSAGYQMHVAKPVEPDELVLVVARLAGRAAAH